MKSYRHLYDQVSDFSNLYRAWQKARRGKRSKATVIAFGQNLDRELLRLHNELLDESYQPGAYTSFIVHDPKRRKISAAPFRDRVAHHALCNIIEPIYDQKFIFDSYANRKGKGTHAALDRCTEFMRRYRYVLPCDVQQFFPSIDQAILKGILAKTIACERTFRLCEKIIDSGVGVLDGEYRMRWFDGDDLFTPLRPRGLPIGNLTSQFWANVYLNPLDQFIKHTLRCKGYVRYVDDFMLFCDDKHQLSRWRQEIITFLIGLRLTLHEQRARPRPTSVGVSFLGFVVFPAHRLLRYPKMSSYRRYLDGLYRAYKQGDLSRQQLHDSVLAWIGHARNGDTWGLRTQIFDRMVL